MTPEERAEAARTALVSRYRAFGAFLLASADALEHIALAELADRPVRYLHPGARAEEEALEAALTAL